MRTDSLLIKVKHAEYILHDYQLKLTFSDGLIGVVDLKGEIWGEVFEPLLQSFYKRSLDNRLGLWGRLCA